MYGAISPNVGCYFSLYGSLEKWVIPGPEKKAYKMNQEEKWAYIILVRQGGVIVPLHPDSGMGKMLKVGDIH